jgi:hypothetical protein
MPAPIYLPQRQNPFMQLLPMLFQMGMQRQAIAAREDAATKAYHRGLEAQGYQEMDEGLMMTTEGQLHQQENIDLYSKEVSLKLFYNRKKLLMNLSNWVKR